MAGDVLHPQEPLRAVPDDGIFRISVREACMARVFCVALSIILGTALIGISSAQNSRTSTGYDPVSPIAPTSDQECDALSSAWQIRKHQLSTQTEMCSKAVLQG